ncbi:MAG: hypothetical protein VX610_01645 [SAR324 cluster bacterium]|nr:hypothetical protein [SAR324 cluster bacterium]
MEAYTVRKTREHLSQIFKSGKTIEIKHPTNPAILMPKERYLELEKELVNLQMDVAEAQCQKKYSTEQVEAMIAQVKGRPRG